MISQDAINEALTPKTLAPKGRYNMVLTEIKGYMAKTGTASAELTFKFATEDGYKYWPARYRLFKAKGSTTENSEVTERALAVIGDAYGVLADALGGLDFAVDGEEAFITLDGVPLDVTNGSVLVNASVDIEQYENRYGGTSEKSVIKNINKIIYEEAPVASV